MAYKIRLEERRELIRVCGKRPGSQQIGQLLTDVLNARKGTPRRLRRRRFELKWEVSDWKRLGLEVDRLTRNGLGNPAVPVFRVLDGEINFDTGDWVFVQEDPSIPVPEEVAEDGTKVVRRGKATRKDREQSTSLYINRHGVLDRILKQKILQYLRNDNSEGAALVVSLCKPIFEMGKVDVRDFPYGRYISCGSIWSVALLEACYLLYTDRYIEKCFISEHTIDDLKRCGLSPCKAPYFIPSRRGVRGCREHRGREFRNSAAYKRLQRLKQSSRPKLKQETDRPDTKLIPSGRILDFGL